MIRFAKTLGATAAVALLTLPALAQDKPAAAPAPAAPVAPAAVPAPVTSLSYEAIGMFILFVLLTLFITYRAARSSKSASDYYAAGGGITGLQNGLAIAGDYMSAASFLGISGIRKNHNESPA